MSRAERDVAAMAASQFGVLTKAQALDCGLSEWTIRRLVRAGRLERVGTHCVRPAGQPETWRQLLTVGLLDLGPEAVVAGRAAAALFGLDCFGEGPLEFYLPRARRERVTIGSVRSGPPLEPIDRATASGFPCTSATRTILDLAAAVDERGLECAVDSALRLGFTSEDFLRRRLASCRRTGRAGVAMLDRVLAGSGGHSFLERTFLGLIREAGLPRPVCQRAFREGTAVIARTDFCFEPAAKVICEVNGHATHATRRQRQHDEERRTELVIRGYVVLTFTYEDVMERPAWVVEVVRQVMACAIDESRQENERPALEFLPGAVGDVLGGPDPSAMSGRLAG